MRALASSKDPSLDLNPSLKTAHARQSTSATTRWPGWRVQDTPSRTERGIDTRVSHVQVVSPDVLVKMVARNVKR